MNNKILARVNKFKIISYASLFLIAGFFIFGFNINKAEAVCTSSGATPNWNTTGTWSCGYVPTSSDDVTIAAGSVVQVNTAAVAKSVTLAAATTSNGIAILTGQSLTISGTIACNSGAAVGLCFATNNQIHDQTITLNGTGNLTTTSITMPGNTGGAAASFSKIGCASSATGTLTVSTSGTISITGSSTASNSGTTSIDMSGGACKVTTGTGTTTITAGSVSAGLLQTGTGNLTLNGNLTFSGTASRTKLTTGSGSTITIASTTTVSTGGTLSITSTTLTANANLTWNNVTASLGWAACNVTAGTTTFSSAQTCTSVSVSAGATLAMGTNILTDSGNLTVNGTLSGSGAGGVTISGPSSVLDGNTSNGGAASVTNSGTIQVTGATPSVAATANLTINNLTVAAAASFTVTAGGTLATTGNVIFAAITTSKTHNINGTFNIGGTLSLTAITTASVTRNITLGSSGVLSVTGTTTMNQPTTNSNITDAININAGTATFTGLLTFAGSGTTTTRVSKLVITTGTVNANGGITFVGSALATKVIDMSGGAGTLNLGGTTSTLTVATASCTWTMGTSSTVVYKGSGSQTVTMPTTAQCTGGYNNLTILNTTGATLGADATATNLTGNLTVGDDSTAAIFANGGHAIAGVGGKTFLVNNLATFKMTGSTENLPTTITSSYDSNSTIEFDQTTSIALTTGKSYGNVLFKPASGSITFTLLASITIGGNLNVGGGGATSTIVTALDNDPTISVPGIMTIAASSTFVASDTNDMTVTGNWSNSGTFTASGRTVTLNGSVSQSVTTGSSAFYNLTCANTSGSSPGITFVDGTSVSHLLKDITASSVLTFTAGTTSILNDIQLNGTAIGTRIVIRSTTTSVANWTVAAVPQTDVSYVNVSYNDASSGFQIDASNGTNNDGLNNVNWHFTGNAPPTLSVSQPDGVSDTVVVGASYNITYSLHDSDNVVTAAFYYDSNNSGLDGTAITGACATAAEGTNVTCAWNTTGMALGTYYVYGITNDGTNSAVSAYSPGQITISTATLTRITTITFETRQLGSSGGIGSAEGANLYDGTGTSTIETNPTYVRTGAASLKIANAADWAWTRAQIISPSAAEKYIRLPVYITALPSGADLTILGIDDGAGGWTHNVGITVAGDIVMNGTGFTITGTKPVTVGAWNVILIHLKQSNTAAIHEFKFGGETVTDTTNDTVTDNLSDLYIENGGAMANTVYFDDIAVNTDGYPSATGKSDILFPISDNSIGVWTGGAGGTSNLYDAVNNTPPAGLASGSETDATDIHTSTNTAGSAADFNLETYSTIGIQSYDTMSLVVPIVRSGEPVVTNTKTGKIGLVSNPAITGLTFTYGNDVGAQGAEIGNWYTSLGTTTYSPSVTVGSSPVIRVTKETTTSGNDPVAVDFLGLIVEWVPGTPNTAPTLSISQPDGTSDTVTVGDSYNITYTLADPDNVVTAAFYYDSNSSGLDGVAITGPCATAAEGTSVTCAWNTTGMTPGTYYVYGITNDGVNPAVSAYSPGQITINSGVSQTLTFSLGATTLALGTLSSSAVVTGSHTMNVSTNASGGMAVTVSGTTLTSGIYTISACATNCSSTATTEQFGINLVANTTPSVGANPSGTPTIGVAATNYNTANSFRFVSGETIASSTGAINDTTFTISYIVNIAATTEAATYNTNLTYVATATF